MQDHTEANQGEPGGANERTDVGPRPTARRLWSIAAAVVVVAASARVSVPIPGTPVPQSLQTLAVVLVGGWLGARLGAGALVAYVCAGALGLPVFADGAAGFSHLTGPTAGYLAGFVAAAALMGRWVDAARAGHWASALAGAALAHLVILGLGWAWLARLLGPGAAYGQGVAPFLLGGVVKSAVAAPVLTRLRPPARPPGDG